jgi:hypothetical protein
MSLVLLWDDMRYISFCCLREDASVSVTVSADVLFMLKKCWDTSVNLESVKQDSFALRYQDVHFISARRLD